MINKSGIFSKSCSHALKAATFVGKKGLENKSVKLKEIAEEINSPLAFTAKILQKLVKANIIESIRGAKGGFFVSQEKLRQISLKEIVFAIDGEGSYNGCALGFEKCNASKPCALHFQILPIREKLKESLINTSLEDLARAVGENTTFLKE
jgi:Rrf2 family protein